jgi:hypothetical protein
MAFDQDLAASVRTALVGAGAIRREVKMFGGIGFMFNGNLVAASPNAACSCASARTIGAMHSRSRVRGQW